MVWIRACRPLYLLSNLKSREILKTLSILASCGPTLRNLRLTEFIWSRMMSMAEEHTTKKSNTFQLFSK
jgi:hypothetical protein